MQGLPQSIKKRPRIELGLMLLAVTVFLFALPVLLGWQSPESPSVSQFRAWSQMQFNTAMGLSFLSLALVALRSEFFGLSRMASLFALVLGAGTLFQYVTGISLGIDELFRMADTAILKNPGRMAPNTAVSLVSCGLAIFLLSLRGVSGNAVLFSGVLAGLSASLGLIKIVSYLLSLSGSLDPGSFLHMAPATAVGVTLSGLVISMSVILHFKDTREDSYRTHSYIMILMMLVVVISIWQTLLNLEMNHVQKLVHVHAENLIKVGEDRLESELLALSRFAARLEHLGTTDRTYLEKDAEAYLKQIPVLRRLGLIGRDYKVYWSYPPELRHQITGFDQSKNEIRVRALEASMKSRYPVPSELLDLKSQEKGFLIPVPIYSKKQFSGFFYATASANKLFDRFSGNPQFEYRVSDDHGVFYRRTVEGTVEEMALEVSFSWGLAELKVAVIPTQEFINDNKSWFPYLFLVGGCLISILFGLFQQSRAYARWLDQVRLSEKNERDQLLKQNERRLKHALEGSSDGVWDWDLKNQEMYVSEKMADFFGGPQTVSTADPAQFTSVIHPDDREKTMKSIQQHLEGKSLIHEVEARLKNANGEYVWVLTRGKISERDEKGMPLRMTGVHINIHDLKSVQEELNFAQAQAFAASKAKSQFLASMSHEIRTPLNAIIGMTDLAYKSKVRSEQRQYLEIIRQSGSSLLNIINDVLDFSKIESGKIELNRERFSLSYVAESQVELLSIRATERSITLSSFIAPELPKYYLSDSGRIAQVLLNLLGNAVKFTQKGGVILRVVPSERVSMGSERWIRFEVRDTGIGIDPADQVRLFKPFSQANPAIAGTYGGTGLGLSISHRLVELLGGEIGVESRKGQGSVFWFEIPLELADQGSAKALELEAGALRVLVIEKDILVAKTMRDYLQAWKMKSTFVKSLSEGILAIKESKQAKRGNFSLIFLGGLKTKAELSRMGKQLRKHPLSRHSKLVILAKSSFSADATQLKKLGIFDVVHKPLKQSQLFDVIARATGAKFSRKRDRNLSVVKTQGEKHLKVLLAEDVAANQLLARKLLERLGYVVAVASNGRELLDLYHQSRYDLILMDCQMPEMDGYEATAHIRRLEENGRAKIPIVALTANAMDEDRRRCIEAGMDDYLSKPITESALKTMLDKWLNSSQQKAA